ncbi:PTS mannitol transporter subunit IICBA [Nocardioides mangrovi]|uniref:Mannitol-specific phosphotransferase enzyme IIA component n=1 Tax=Nocardioides mangrovi TaxID=2874580 RepID=A0ABS7UJN8_9ACTN|nr:PTS mannitol transporter subunit IICBA [Nocardioides mangrovi]MBZ5741089.1 PTS mannitol transporter subunit IICBA [Nocardioides mangrovi]
MSSTTGAPRSPGGARVHVQRFGTFLSNMVLPNIGAFIAWGFITALFIQTGWITLIGDKIFGYPAGLDAGQYDYGFVSKLGGWDADGGGIVGPMITYLLPILIGYTGGRMAYGGDAIRGGVVGAIATMGAVTGADVPMFLGAMVMGPLGGWSMRKLDESWEGKIKPGFEMLVNNFSAGIWGMILALAGFAVAGPFVEQFSKGAGHAVDWLVGHNLMPLASIFVEPAKVLFLNNAINHGVFTPLGINEAAEKGHSLLFLVEANPGPGLGLLLAFTFFGKGFAKASAPGAILIQFVGGIHEIYFPYVLMKPKLIVALILGGMTGVATNQALDTGLRSPASPGSIIAVWLSAPASSLFGVTLSVVLAAAVTFLVASFLLRMEKGDDEGDLTGATAAMEAMKGKKSLASSVLATGHTGAISSIVFACDAGMGSSAMGASVLRKKIQDAGYGDVTVVNKAISSLTDTYDLVVTHQDLTDRATQKTPSAVHVSVDNFMSSPRYDEVVELVRERNGAGSGAPVAVAEEQADSGPLLAEESIVLDGGPATRDDAITRAGELLVAAGAVDASYVAAMHAREASVSTAMGNMLAIPHGTNEAKADIRRTALSFVHYPQGINWNGREVKYVVGVAALGNEHLKLMAQLAEVFVNPERVRELERANSPLDVMGVLGQVRRPAQHA